MIRFELYEILRLKPSKIGQCKISNCTSCLDLRIGGRYHQGYKSLEGTADTSFGPLVYPPQAPPSALPRVLLMMLTLSHVPVSSGVPRPVLPGVNI